MSEDFRGLYDLRLGKPEDRNFILATFLRGLYYGDSWFSLIPKDIFMESYKHIAMALVEKRTIVVACLKEDPDVILGYSICSSDGTTIDWLFVKSAWRGKGIGRSLVPATVTTATHLSALGKTLITKNKVTFNPFKLS